MQTTPRQHPERLAPRRQYADATEHQSCQADADADAADAADAAAAAAADFRRSARTRRTTARAEPEQSADANVVGVAAADANGINHGPTTAPTTRRARRLLVRVSISRTAF